MSEPEMVSLLFSIINLGNPQKPYCRIAVSIPDTDGGNRRSIHELMSNVMQNHPDLFALLPAKLRDNRQFGGVEYIDGTITLM